MIQASVDSIGRNRRASFVVRFLTTALLSLTAGALAVPPSQAPSAAAATKAAKKSKPKRTVARTTQRASTTAKGGSVSTVATSLPTTLAGALSGPDYPTYGVTVRTQTIVDDSRSTAATAVSPAKKSRTLETLVITPKEGGKKFPLLVFGHGLGGEPVAYQKLLERLAATGLVVAAPAFPLSNAKSPGGPSIVDEPNQPGDVSVVITEMLKDPTVDSESVFVGGHSLGGITTVDLIGNPALLDKRIDAAVVIAGTVNPFSFVKFFQGTPAVPVLFLHGDADAVVPISLGMSTYRLAKAPKWFVTVVGGDHVFGLAGAPGEREKTAARYAEAMLSFLHSVPSGKEAVSNSMSRFAKANGSAVRLEFAL